MRAADAFAIQSRACAKLDSPFMGRMLPLLWQVLESDTGAVAARVKAWPGDLSPSGHSVPLRLAGALHALVLQGKDAALVAAYPPQDVGDDVLKPALAAAVLTHEAQILRWLDSAPQTNEVRRSAALLAGAAWLAGRCGLPFVLSELGASAGLNMAFDAYALETPCGVIGAGGSPVRFTPDWQGAAAPAPAPITVQDRAGIDLNPLDPSEAGDALRILAYLWPDQPYRAALTRNAIALATTRPARGDAAPWLEARLAPPCPGALHLVYNTIAWQYFPPETAARCEAALQDAGARATQHAPLAHLAMEADALGDGAALTVRLWPGGARKTLARVDFHGRWIKWAA
ncbi:DUF2332 domain-containing protein [Alterinioella nitratireducens]|uniref:DUF2332 domain-containing protein n=1 Tax=Alterinioella nitratireducens TaxID=2735915 RepID=UPI001557121D|nr:DUF2332 family protein [Alterinioella nitratireducens]NPD20435.1 DUF2332 family protein [Alterinioella nitratireducens]